MAWVFISRVIRKNCTLSLRMIIAPFSRFFVDFAEMISTTYITIRDWPQISASANNLRATNVVENTPTMVRTTRWDASLLKVYGTGGRYLWHLYLHNNILKIDSDVKDQLYKWSRIPSYYCWLLINIQPHSPQYQLVIRIENINSFVKCIGWEK